MLKNLIFYLTTDFHVEHNIISPRSAEKPDWHSIVWPEHDRCLIRKWGKCSIKENCAKWEPCNLIIVYTCVCVCVRFNTPGAKHDEGQEHILASTYSTKKSWTWHSKEAKSSQQVISDVVNPIAKTTTTTKGRPKSHIWRWKWIWTTSIWEQRQIGLRQRWTLIATIKFLHGMRMERAVKRNEDEGGG